MNSVVGSELSTEAVEQLFIDLKIISIIQRTNIYYYSTRKIDILQEIFAMIGSPFRLLMEFMTKQYWLYYLKKCIKNILPT